MAKSLPTTSATGAASLRTLKGKSFHLAGRFGVSDAEEEARRVVGLRGGKVVKKVTADLDYLVVGQAGFSSAKREAETLNRKQGAEIQVLNEKAFFALVAPTREEAIALLTGGKADIERWQALMEGYGVHWPNLKGADLRAMVVPESVVYLDLERLGLEGADFRGARLHNVWFRELKGVNFDGAYFEESSVDYGFRGCTIRNAECKGADWVIAVLDGSDFTGSRLTYAGLRLCRGKGVVFAKADLTNADVARTVLPGADFTGANLTGADLNLAKLRGAKLAGATLRGAALTGADLSGADLTNADLRDAELTAADLRRAKLRGVRLAGAGLQRARITRDALSAAKDVDAEKLDLGSRFGPRLKELDGATRKSLNVEMEVVFASAGDETKVFVHAYGGTTIRALWGDYEHEPEEDSRESIDSNSLATVMLSAAHRFRGAAFRPEALSIKSSKCPVSGKALKELALAAWREACGGER